MLCPAEDEVATDGNQQASDSIGEPSTIEAGKENNRNKTASKDFNCCLLLDESTAVKNPNLLFIFSGQGTQYPLMGLQLYQKEHVFRATLDHCSSLVKGWDPELDIVQELQRGWKDSKIYSARMALVIIPALQMALVDVLRSKGVEPAGKGIKLDVAQCMGQPCISTDLSLSQF